MIKDDEQAIRDLVDLWLTATKKGDLKTILGLMDDDVLFHVPGKEPFGKKEFELMSMEIEDTLIEGKGDIREIKILGDWAWMRNYLTIKIKSKEGKSSESSGYILTILRKKENGKWVIYRDANLLIHGKG